MLSAPEKAVAIARQFRAGALIFATALTIMAGLVMVGWLWNIEAFRMPVTDTVSPKFNTAVSLFLLGSGVLVGLCRPNHTGRTIVMVIGLVAVLLGGLTLGQDIWETDFGIDQLVVTEFPISPLTVHPGRMSPITSVLVVMGGVALMLAWTGWLAAQRGATVITSAVLVVALICFAGYTYGFDSPFAARNYTPMSPVAALGFLFFSFAMLLGLPSDGLMTPISSPHLGGYVARRLIPVAFIVPLALGSLGVHTERLRLLESGYGMPVFAALNVVVMVMLVWAVANSLNSVDRQRADTVRLAQQRAADLEKSEGRLREQARVLGSILDTMSDCVVMTDLEGRLLMANPAARALFGPDIGTLNAREWAQRFGIFVADGSDWLNSSALPIVEALQDRVTENVEILLRNPPSAERFLLASGQPLRDDSGRVVAGIMVMRDITMRRAAEQALQRAHEQLELRVEERTRELAEANKALEARSEELQQAGKELESFSYSVSHDLRAPLRSIDGFSLAILEDCADSLDEQGRDYLARVRAATQRMARLIDDLLKLSRVGRHEIRRRPVDLSLLAHRVVEELQLATPGRIVDVQIDDGILVDGDPQLLRIVMDNLIGNAWKFTENREVARIRIGTTENGGSHCIYVADNGAGFNMKYAGKLFAPFQRLHTEAQFPGTGIGLATVQRIISRHGGKIWAHAEPDNGATFYLILPDVEAPNDDKEQAYSAGGRQPGRRSADHTGAEEEQHL